MATHRARLLTSCLLLAALVCVTAQEIATPQNVEAINPAAVLNPVVLYPAAVESDDDAAAGTASLGRRGGVAGGKPVRPGRPRPGPVQPSPPPPVGGPDPPGPPQEPDFPQPPKFEEKECIDDPEVFARVFNEGTADGAQARCVSDDIIVRINQDFRPLDGTSRDALSMSVVDGLKKATSFWSYGDNPEKYLRIGRDNMVLGNFVDNPQINNGLGDAGFSGIKSMSNFAALLEAVGYGSSSTNPKVAYLMVIAKRPNPLKASVYEPTWKNVTTYFNHYVKNIAATDPAAIARSKLSAADLKAIKDGFMLDSEVAKYLSKTSFADLTGCPATCTYQDVRFGSIGGERGNNWLSPTKDGSRDGVTGQCMKPTPRQDRNFNTTWTPADLVLTEPTIIDNWASACSNKEYQAFQKSFGDNCTTGGARDMTENRALGLLMAQRYLAAGDDLVQKVAIFRAYLTQSCAGSFNPLFSGDGFTYTGNGGFLGATGTEVHVGEVAPARMAQVFERVRLVYFCPAQMDGSIIEHAICPFGGKFDKGQLESYAGIQGSWDIAEVRHPLDPAP